jgi:hypothetical protein
VLLPGSPKLLLILSNWLTHPSCLGSPWEAFPDPQIGLEASYWAPEHQGVITLGMVIY